MTRANGRKPRHHAIPTVSTHAVVVPWYFFFLNFALRAMTHHWQSMGNNEKKKKIKCQLLIWIWKTEKTAGLLAWLDECCLTLHKWLTWDYRCMTRRGPAHRRTYGVLLRGAIMNPRFIIYRMKARIHSIDWVWNEFVWCYQQVLVTMAWFMFCSQCPSGMSITCWTLIHQRAIGAIEPYCRCRLYIVGYSSSLWLIRWLALFSLFAAAGCSVNGLDNQYSQITVRMILYTSLWPRESYSGLCSSRLEVHLVRMVHHVGPPPFCSHTTWSASIIFRNIFRNGLEIVKRVTEGHV